MLSWILFNICVCANGIITIVMLFKIAKLIAKRY